MTTELARLATMAVVSLGVAGMSVGETLPRMLPGELSAEAILNGAYPFPPSPHFEVTYNPTGFASDRISKVPPAGVHPRILLSPADLPDLRKRLKETETGRALYATLKVRTDAVLRDPRQWSARLYQAMSEENLADSLALIEEHGGFPPAIGHYQPWMYALVMEAFHGMVDDDRQRGRRAANAIAIYARIVSPGVEKVLSEPLNDDVWRVMVPDGSGFPTQSPRDAVGGHLLGYAYDFAHAFMTDTQRSEVRRLIAHVTHGRVWMGVRLPHHFRNWNWIAVGLQQPLLCLAIEGEEGYDPRIYRMGVEVTRDYLTYGISPAGSSTEAVGYTQFGLVWANPFMVAAARRGDNLLTHSHHRAMLDWYLQSMEPPMRTFTSHGDGGDGPPCIWTYLMWRYYFPNDPKADFLWQCFATKSQGTPLTASALDMRIDAATRRLAIPENFSPFNGSFHVIEPLLWATDGIKGPDGGPVDYQGGRALGLATSFSDPVRGSLNARSAWDENATSVQFECRVDSVGGSHEHSDRGNFTLFANGRAWAKENFRSVETRHHNNILIDGLGQGYWPGPGKWLEHEEMGDLITCSVNLKDAYDWWWPKQIKSEPGSASRFRYPRWARYAIEAADFQKEYVSMPLERDPRPAVVAFWRGFSETDPRLWDEDAWPVRLPHNTVQRAYRTLAFLRGDHPWLLVVDDVQKDDNERLYEWMMQTGVDTEVVSISGNDIILGDAPSPDGVGGDYGVRSGARRLLVRVMDLKDPADPHRHTTKPSFRLETFERKDTLVPEAREGDLSGSRSFGLDKRLVVASRSVAPDFKVLLFPFRKGEALPVTTWNADFTRLLIVAGGRRQELSLQVTDGRTVVRGVEEHRR